jgi:hypothetical protein
VPVCPLSFLKRIFISPMHKSAPRPESICLVCGATATPGCSYCRSCAIPVATEHIREVAQAGREAGRLAAQSAEAQVRRANSQRPHALARWAWDPSSQPAWLTEEIYVGKIQTLLAGLRTKQLRQPSVSQSLTHPASVRVDVFHIRGIGKLLRNSQTFLRRPSNRNRSWLFGATDS